CPPRAALFPYTPLFRSAHIWLGAYRKNSEARVFKNFRIEPFDTPDDARFYFGADWGYSNDPTVLVRCFVQDKTLFVDQEAYQIRSEEHTSELQSRGHLV